MYEKIKQEIERRKRQFRFACADDAFYHREKREMVVAYEELDKLLSFIESLEKEQEEDLEKEIEDIIECEKEYMNFQSKNQLIKYIARHFYELGCKQKDNAPKIKGWVARDECRGDASNLYIGQQKPRRVGNTAHGYGMWCDYGEFMALPEWMFPELKFTDEPIEVELTIHRV